MTIFEFIEFVAALAVFLFYKLCRIVPKSSKVSVYEVQEFKPNPEQ